MDKWFFERHIRRASLVHFVGPSDIKTMVDRVGISGDGTKIVRVSAGSRYQFWGVLDAAWNNAWIETRHGLQLPFQEWRAPAADMVVGGNPKGESIVHFAMLHQQRQGEDCHCNGS